MGAFVFKILLKDICGLLRLQKLYCSSLMHERRLQRMWPMLKLRPVQMAGVILVVCKVTLETVFRILFDQLIIFFLFA